MVYELISPAREIEFGQKIVLVFKDSLQLKKLLKYNFEGVETGGERLRLVI